MAAKTVSYEELIEYAMAHYNNGGDGVYECWDKRAFDDYVAEFGGITKRKALSIFRLYKETTDDVMGW